MVKLRKWQPDSREVGGGGGSHSLNSSQLPAGNTFEGRRQQGGCSRALCCSKSVTLSFKAAAQLRLIYDWLISSTGSWFTWMTTSSSTTPTKTPSRSPWRSWGACTSSPLPKSDWRQRVSRTRARKSGGLHGGYGRHVNFFLFLSLMRGIRKAMRRCLGWFMVFCIIWNVVGQGVLGAAIPHAVWAEVFLMWFFF